ncbi:MAG: NAD(P)-dependent oxidoreductase [Acidobacteriaceae bacterium]|nr:NAD(P)-dependent oxidoreductase [Acidobacteriaceae bacterium]MBV9780082.1 NAD(P)-dependent oxidoreductase [Acidobacteriaceae bacterium]
MKFLVTGGTGFIGWRVARNLLSRGVPVVVADWNIDPSVQRRLTAESGGLAEFVECDVSDAHDIARIFSAHPEITHAVHLAYLMSAEVEADPPLSVRVNVLGMANMFETALKHRLQRLVFTSSETVYGASQRIYGDRPITEVDFCSPADHVFTYGVMKILNEFMAQKYVQRHGIDIVCTRPPVVFGHGRKRGSLLWAESFVSLPAIGEPVSLPFASETRDCWVYVDDCAEQLVRLALKPTLAHFSYNSTGCSVSARQFADCVRYWLPEAKIAFDENKPVTPLVDDLDGSRLVEEIDFTPRTLKAGILAHINEAREAASLPPLAAASHHLKRGAQL